MLVFFLTLIRDSVEHDWSDQKPSRFWIHVVHVAGAKMRGRRWGGGGLIETRKGRERAIFPSSSTSFDACFTRKRSYCGKCGQILRLVTEAVIIQLISVVRVSIYFKCNWNERKNDVTVNLNCFKVFCFLLDPTNFLGCIELVMLYPLV